MKICAISPFITASTQEILDFMRKCSHDLIVLPGNSQNHPNYRDVSGILQKGVFAFVETGAGKGKSVPWLVSSSSQVRMPPQVFATNPKACELDELQRRWSKRTHGINGRKCSFAICGEVDAFDKKGIEKKGRKLPYEILINPTHTARGRWNHLGAKLEALSKGTVVVYVANNNFNRHDVTTHLRIYKDGQIINRDALGKFALSECEI